MAEKYLRNAWAIVSFLAHSLVYLAIVICMYILNNLKYVVLGSISRLKLFLCISCRIFLFYLNGMRYINNYNNDTWHVHGREGETNTYKIVLSVL